MVRIRQISCYTWYSEVQRFIQTAVRREEPEDNTSTSVCTSVLSVRVTCTGWARGCGTGTCTSRRAGDAQPPSRSWGPLCSAPPLTSSGSGPPRDKPSLGGCWSRSLHLCESTWRNWARAPRWLNVRFGYRVWVSPSRSAMLSKNSQLVSRGPFLTKLT